MNDPTVGNVPANQPMPQIRAGTIKLTTSNQTVAFSQPMTDANYVVLIESGMPNIVIKDKTAKGFNVSSHANSTVSWVAVHFI